jgi:hypothetical protein
MKKWYKYAVEDLKQSFQSNPNITYFVSFPKSGITWLRLMMAQLFIKTYDLQLEQPTIQLNDLTFKHSILPKIYQTHDDSLLIDEKGNRSDPEKLFTYGGRLRYRKNKVLLLVRDPRDVVISHYYQVTKRSDRPLQFNSVSEFVQHPLCGFRRIIRFYTIWDRNRWIPSDFLLVRYEDLMSQGPETLQNILKFLDVDNISPSLIDEVYEMTQADKMRKLEMQGKIDGMRSFGEVEDVNTLKVRRAKIGSYKDELSEEDIKYCNKLMKHLPKIYRY